MILWSAIVRIDTSPKYAFIYLNPVNAYIIPRHAFATDAEFHAFVDLAQRYFADARSQ